jgi:hypothetical protein
MSEESSLGPFPTTIGIEQLVWLIRAVAAGEVSPEEFIKSFRDVHEMIESVGKARYESKEQARLIWDVLWDVEWYSPNPYAEERPEEWTTLEDVLKTARRSAKQLQALGDKKDEKDTSGAG